MFAPTMFALVGTSMHLVEGQLPGTVAEMPPPVDVAHCTKLGGCNLQHTAATLDANWRWIHGVQCNGEGANRHCSTGGNCYTGTTWDQSQCPDPETCAEKCALEAVTAEQYTGTYGVSAIAGGLELKFVTGQNVGSRLYLTEEDGETYKIFKLKNREFAFDVDVSTLACGLNGAVYFSEMDATGGFGDGNKAGAKYGTGYCDAQCPHDVKFMNGVANILEWNSTTAFGKFGACCAEMDIWEANREATAFTTHPCSIEGTKPCTGLDCGGMPGELQHRYDGVCDKDGCDFNSYRDGDEDFFGDGPRFKVDSSKPLTVVTQWLTKDGTDEGELSEIRRLLVQDRKVIENSVAIVLGGQHKQDHSITDSYCDAQKATFGDRNEHRRKGGLKAMGEALERGMVLVVSLWDDSLTHMKWLDARMGNASRPGSVRGPCKESSGSPDQVRAQHSEASVKYTNFMYGELDSTYTAEDGAKPEAATQRQWPAQQRPQEPAWQVNNHADSEVQGAATSKEHFSSHGGEGLEAYAQCGGDNSGGLTTCAGSCQCVSHGSSYSQCTPPDGAWTCEMSSPIGQASMLALNPLQSNAQYLYHTHVIGAVAAFGALVVAVAVKLVAVRGQRDLPVDAHEAIQLLGGGEDA